MLTERGLAELIRPELSPLASLIKSRSVIPIIRILLCTHKFAINLYMNFNKQFFNALKSQLKAEANIDLSVVPKSSLPLLVMDSLSLDAENKSQSSQYSLSGNITLNLLSEFADDDEYLGTFDTANSIVTAIHREQVAISARQPPLALTEISFDSMRQEILTEQEGNKYFSAIELNFSFQIY